MKTASASSVSTNVFHTLICFAVLFKGANYASHPKKSIPAGTSHLLLQNEIPLEDTLAYLSEAAKASAVTIFNPSPMPSDAELKAFPWDKLTWLIVNEGEASDMYKTLSGGSIHSIPDISGSPYAHLSAYPTLLQLSSQIPQTNLVCTLGAAGVLTLIPSLGASPGLNSEPIFLPAAKLQRGVVDTTGAGDCFAGYMVAGLMKLHDEGIKVLQREHIVAVLKRCVQVRVSFLIPALSTHFFLSRLPECALKREELWKASPLPRRSIP